MTPRLNVLLVLLACLGTLALGMYLRRQHPATPADTGARPETPAARSEDAMTLLKRYECTYCHISESPFLTANYGASNNCVVCHNTPKHGPTKNQIIVRYVAPNLQRIGNRLRPDWIRQQLKQPRVIRPHMRELMPDFRLTDAEIDTLTTWIVNAAPPVEPVGDPSLLVRQADPQRHDALIGEGRRLAEEYGCWHCHEYSGFEEPILRRINEAKLEGWKEYRVYSMLLDIAYFTPDLRYARERMRPEQVAGYIQNRAGHDPSGFMTVYDDMPIEHAQTLAYMVLHADLGPMPELAPKPIPVPENPDFVNDVVPLIEQYCVSCHYEEQSPMMSWATGNRGGFGFPARNYHMHNYESLMGTARLDGGTPYHPIVPGDKNSIFLRRLRGEMYPPMPFGQKIRPEHVRIFENWIVNGAKGER